MTELHCSRCQTELASNDNAGYVLEGWWLLCADCAQSYDDWKHVDFPDHAWPDQYTVEVSTIKAVTSRGVLFDNGARFSFDDLNKNRDICDLEHNDLIMLK